jgi:hypothetical protein
MICFRQLLPIVSLVAVLTGAFPAAAAEPRTALIVAAMRLIPMPR